MTFRLRGARHSLARPLTSGGIPFETSCLPLILQQQCCVSIPYLPSSLKITRTVRSISRSGLWVSVAIMALGKPTCWTQSTISALPGVISHGQTATRPSRGNLDFAWKVHLNLKAKRKRRSAYYANPARRNFPSTMSCMKNFRNISGGIPASSSPRMMRNSLPAEAKKGASSSMPCFHRSIAFTPESYCLYPGFAAAKLIAEIFR